MSKNLNNPGGGLTSVPIGNSVFVSKLGDDATGERANLSKPFLTCGAAVAAAVGGDTVFVYPGTYDEKNLLKNLVNWNLLLGAIIEYTGSDAGAIYDDSVATGTGGAVACTLEGVGTINRKGSGGSAHVVLLEAASNLLIVDNIIGSTVVASATIKLDGASAQVTFTSTLISKGAFAGLVVEVVAGAECAFINSDVDGKNNGAIIVAGGAGEMSITEGTVKNNDTGTSATCILKSGTSKLALRSITLINLGGDLSTPTTITSAPADAQDVLVYSGVANKDVGPDITEKINSLIIDPEVTV